MSELDQKPQPTEPNTPVEQSLLGSQPTDTPIDQPESTPQEQPQTATINSIDDYKVEVDGFNYDEFKAIPENQEFLERAKEAGIDNKALNFALKEYSEIIPRVMAANAAMDTETCTAEMKQVWGNDADTNFKAAHTASNHLINHGILTAEEVNDPRFGNLPAALKMAAYLGSQLSEDTPPRNTQQSGAVSIEELQRHPAYSDASHPEHKAIAAQVSSYFQKHYPG